MREDVDPRIDKMIAFLYGELPASEERAFRRLLETDVALRSELEELSRTRESLAAWRLEEHVPTFVLVDEGTSRPAPAPVAAPSLLARLRESLRALGAGPAWGLATAAAALVVLAAAGFRAERVPGGVAFRFGGARPAVSPADDLPGLGPGQPIEMARRPEASGPAGGAVVPVGAEYLTQDEFESYNTELMTTLAGLLNRYDERRDRETAELLQALYQRINERQGFDYERVNRRIDALGESLVLETSRNRTIEELLRAAQRPSDSSGPARGAE